MALSTSPTIIFYLKLQDALKRVGINEAKYLKKVDQLSKYESATPAQKLEFRNQKAKWTASMPAVKGSYIDALKELLYELEGYQLACNYIGLKGGSCTAEENQTIQSLFLQASLKLLDLDQKLVIVAAITEADRDFKGVYNYELLQGKDPKTHGQEFLAQIEKYKKESTNAAKAAIATTMANNTSNLAMGSSTNGMGVTTVVNMPATSGNGIPVNTGAGTGLSLLGNGGLAQGVTTATKGKKGKKGQAPTNGSTQGGRRKTRRHRRS